jgi:hypothetical protein
LAATFHAHHGTDPGFRDTETSGRFGDEDLPPIDVSRRLWRVSYAQNVERRRVTLPVHFDGGRTVNRGCKL